MPTWKEYFKKKSSLLGRRSISFDMIFKYLDELKTDKVFIVETGC